MADLVIHPAPMNLINILLLPLVPFRGLLYEIEMENDDGEIEKGLALHGIARCFSLFVFWLENIVIISCFFFLELLLSPFMFINSFITIITCTEGFFTMVGNLLVWTTCGIFITLYTVLFDVAYLTYILYMHDGC